MPQLSASALFSHERRSWWLPVFIFTLRPQEEDTTVRLGIGKHAKCTA